MATNIISVTAILISLASIVSAADRATDVTAWMRSNPDWVKPLVPFVNQNCRNCHADGAAEGGFTLKQLQRDLADVEMRRRWAEVHDRVSAGEMPPKSESPPDEASRHEFLKKLNGPLAQADRLSRRKVLRRLNGIEYEHTVRDLFGLDPREHSFKQGLPEDASAGGFDNNAAALAISTEQMQAYLQVARRVTAAVQQPPRVAKRIHVKNQFADDPYVQRYLGKIFKKTPEGVALFQTGGPAMISTGRAPVNGVYRVRIQAKTIQTSSPLVLVVFGGQTDVNRLNNVFHLAGFFEVASSTAWTDIELTDYIKAGEWFRMGVVQYWPATGPKRHAGPGIVIGEVEVEGPLPRAPRSDLFEEVDPRRVTADQVRPTLARILPRAFRRPVAADEADFYAELGFSNALAAILCSPEFLFLEERLAPNSQDRIDDYSLASRLSYFLWSSLPDQELMLAADRGELSDPAVLRRQVERMLDDPKSARFVENFTGQWLGLRQIEFTQPDADRYPEFDEYLQHCMLEETRRYFQEVLKHDRSLLEFVDSDWLIVNRRLAEHYGIPNVTGGEFRRITLPPDSVRGGVITQASILKVSANGTDTSPVIRGNWVLENILGQPVSPPPPNVGTIQPDIRGAATIRDLLAKHRDDNSCAVCHRRIDPPGFALESFNPIGGHRDWYRSMGGQPVDLVVNNKPVEYGRGLEVDPSGVLASGQRFADVRQFKRLLLTEHSEQVARCVAEKVMTYAVGREPGFSDRPAINAIVADLRDKNYGFRELIHAVVQSETFQAK